MNTFGGDGWTHNQRLFARRRIAWATTRFPWLVPYEAVDDGNK